MLNLKLTTDKLQVVTSSTAPLACVVSFVDDVIESAGPPRVDIFNSDKQLAKPVTATTTDICAAPAASVVRNVKSMSFTNEDASASNTIQPLYNANATLYDLCPACILLFGESLIYREGVWFHYDANGGVYGQALPVASDTVVGGSRYATQAEMEAASSNVLIGTPGRQHFHPGHAKFVCFTTGTTTPAMQTPPSYNMTSIADAGVGRLTVTIATDFSSANWACLVSGVAISTTLTAVALTCAFHVRFATMAVGTVEANCHDATSITNALADPSGYSVVGYGDL